MGVVLHAVPDPALEDMVPGLGYGQVAREVPVQVLPLHIGRAKSNEDWGASGREKARDGL